MSTATKQQELGAYRAGKGLWGQTGRMRAALVLCIACALAMSSLPGVVAHAASDEVIEGRVTALTAKTIEVDRTSYRLSPDVIIRDKKKGRVREWNEVRVGQEVTLHLAGGTVGLIVVILYD